MEKAVIKLLMKKPACFEQTISSVNTCNNKTVDSVYSRPQASYSLFDQGAWVNIVLWRLLFICRKVST